MESKTSGAMTRPTKRQRRVKAQRASGAKTFNSSFVEMVLEGTHDPDYQPDRENEEVSDGNSPPRQLGYGLALHSMPVDAVGIEDAPENSDHYGSGEESESDVRKRRNISEEFEDAPNEALNDSAMEASAHPSAAVASKTWLEVQIPVRVIGTLDAENCS